MIIAQISLIHLNYIHLLIFPVVYAFFFSHRKVQSHNQKRSKTTSKWFNSLVLPLQGYGLNDICKHESLVNFQCEDEDAGSQWTVVKNPI